MSFREALIKIGLMLSLGLCMSELRGQTTVGPTPALVISNPSTFLVPPMISNRRHGRAEPVKTGLQVSSFAIGEEN
jgi:hypothetical protein